MIVVIVIGIAVLSIFLAVLAARDVRKGLKTKETKAVLQKGRVIFHASHIRHK